ncbi:hypothetical protein L7F22_051222 [Adiantum nelumboides]|nr:hypothetical protein [Adiantum nelumboides]
MPLSEPARGRALGKWKGLLDAVSSDHELGQIAGDLDYVPPSLDEAAKDIYSILQVANEIEKEDFLASLALYEHALSLSQKLDPQSEGRGVLQFKTGLISRIKQNRAARTDISTLATRDPETRSKILQDFCKKYLQTKVSNSLIVEEAEGVAAWEEARGPVIAALDSYVNGLGDLTPYNILPLTDESRNQEILKLPEVKAAKEELKVHIEGFTQEGRDIFDVLEAAFKFQADNIVNQREHLLLLLANTESQFYDKTKVEECLHQETIQELGKILENYESWCSYVGKVRAYDGVGKHIKIMHFVALYLCIWGEAANVRFLPECICYLFHACAEKLNTMLQEKLLSSDIFHNKSFLEAVIVPIYTALREEAEKGKKGKAHSKWRNYDDFNEFFWSQSCLHKLQGWPMENRPMENGLLPSSFFASSKKVSFVEHRTFLHLYHSFVRVWILLLLMLQAMAVLAFTTERNLETLKILLSLAPTFFAMKFIESILDIRMMIGVNVLSRGHAVARIITQFLFYGGFSCGVAYLYWMMLIEKPPSFFYLKLILWVLGPYATLRLIIALLQLVPSVRKLVEIMDKYKPVVSLKWLYKEQFYVGRGLYEHPRDQIRLHKFLPNLIHPAQYGFIKGRNILHNILNVQMGIDYAKKTKQEVVIVQLDLEKAFDHVSWSFLAELMHSMGFGPRMSRLIFTLSLGSQSWIMMNGGVTSPVSLTRSLRQGCPLSPLLFALATHPMLTLLTQLARDGEIVGLTLPSGQQLVGQAFADDSFMFLNANNANIGRAMEAWSLFALASGLHINTQKSALLSCTEIYLKGLGWQGLVVPRGTIVRHLGYPIGVDVTNKQLLDWISGRIGDKFVYWKSQAWPFHVRLKVAQVIMLAMLSYFLPLLPWSRKALTALTQPIRFMLWKKRSNKPGLTWVSWKLISTPKRLGGAALLDVWVHLLARRWTLLQAMCVDSQPWIDMVIAFLEDVGIVQGKTRIAASWWDVVNASQSVCVSASSLLDHLVKSWQEVLRFTSWKPPDCRRADNSLLGEVLATSRVITWPTKDTCRRQFNRMARLGVVRLSDTLLPGRLQILSFRRARHIFSVPRFYKDIWLKLQQRVQALGGLPKMNPSCPWVDWMLGRETRLLKASSNVVYHHLVQDKK